MLQLDATPLTIDGITVFRDHVDQKQFWYLPGPVGLARRQSDNRPAFALFKYKGGAGAASRGGAYLTFEVSLRLDADVERRILARLASITRGQPRLTAVPFDDGTVQCVALNIQGSGGTRANAAAPGAFNAVETILGTAKPSLQGDNSAAFSLELSAEGATLLERAFQERGTPIGIIYDLKFTGLRPALNVRITADFKRIFTHFSTAAEGQRHFLRAGMEAGFEKLVQDGAIKIEVLDFTNTAENATRTKEALDFFQQQVLNTWFTPTLTAGTLAGGQAQAAALDQVVTLGAKLRPPQPAAPARPDPSQPAPEPPNHGPSPTEGTGKGAQTAELRPAAAERAAGSDSPTAGTGNPPAAAPAPASGMAGVSAGARDSGARAANDAADPNAGVVAAFKLKTIRQEEQRTATFEYRRAEAQERSYAPQGFFGLLTADLARDKHIIEIDLDDPFFRTIPIEAKAPFDFASIGLAQIDLALDYGPPTDPTNHRHHDFVFTPDDRGPKRVEFAVNLRKDRTYKASVQLHFDPNSGWDGEKFSYDLPARETEDRTLLLNPAEALGFLEVRIAPHRIDPGIVEAIDVDLSYKDPSGWHQEKSIRFTPDMEPQLWKLRLSNPTARSYSYRLTHRLKDGTVREGPLVTTRATTVLLDDPFPGTLDVTIFPLLDWSAIRAAMLDITYEDFRNDYRRNQRVRLTPEMTETSVRFATVDPTLRNYRHQLTIVRSNGATERGPAIETDEDILSLVG
jgi:hypothetical protein